MPEWDDLSRKRKARKAKLPLFRPAGKPFLLSLAGCVLCLLSVTSREVAGLAFKQSVLRQSGVRSFLAGLASLSVILPINRGPVQIGSHH